MIGKTPSAQESKVRKITGTGSENINGQAKTNGNDIKLKSITQKLQLNNKNDAK